MIGELTNHLWQSTLFAVAAGLLTVVFRKNKAQVRHWLWFSASMKFLLPFAPLMSVGSHLERTSPLEKIAAPVVADAMLQIAVPFSSASSFALPVRHAIDWVPIAIFVWTCGFAAMAVIRLKGWFRIRAAIRASSLIDIPASVQVRSAPGLLEPGVVGLFRPVLLLPEGIIERLTPLQLHAVLAHEMCHVRRRDNLTSAIHMLVEAVFWFHPFVWYIGARMVEERERACDEAVLNLGGDPRDYAEGILSVCKLYVESPLVCVSGVTGANLKRRIEAIIANRTGLRLNRVKKFVLASAGVAVLVGPVVLGLMAGIGNSLVRAQAAVAVPPPANAPAPPVTRPAAPSVAVPVAGAPVPAPTPRQDSGAGPGTPNAKPLEFEVASVKPAAPLTRQVLPRGGPGSSDPAHIRYTYVSLKNLLILAYGMPTQQITGPAWIDSERYDIVANVPGGATTDQVNVMLRNLLADRFQLVVHRETRELQLYELTVAKKGLLIKPYVEDPNEPIHERGKPAFDKNGNIVTPPGGWGFSMGPGGRELMGRKRSIEQLALVLANELGRPVVDKTGLTGDYDYSVKYAPNLTQAQADGGSDGPDLLVAVQEQLGLKLESRKGPIEMLVVDGGQRTPTEN